MMKGVKVTYKGTFEGRGYITQVEAGDKNLPRTNGVATFRIEFHRDAVGREALVYDVQGSPWGRYYVDSAGQIEYMSGPHGGMKTLRPVDQSAGPAMLGFALPPPLAMTYARPPLEGVDFTKQKIIGTPCPVEDTLCINLGVMAGHSGTKVSAQYRVAERTMTTYFPKNKLLEWSFGQPGKLGYPKSVRFTEWDFNGKVTAKAAFELVSEEKSDAVLVASTFIPKEGDLVVMRGQVGYGPYKGSKVGQSDDPWEFYETQRAMATPLDQKIEPPQDLRLPIGIAVLVFVIIAVVSFKFLKR